MNQQGQHPPRSQIDLCRGALSEATLPRKRATNAAWLLRRGLASMSPDNPGAAKGEHIQATCSAAANATAHYRPAYQRWQRLVAADPQRFTHFSAETITRLFVGMAGDNSLETGITLQHVHGMPMIPGSACKGASRAWARESGLEPAAITTLFGADTDAESEAESGLVAFCDALWVPDNQPPLLAEVVTTHHPDYYAGDQSSLATDFDTPIPSALIAARGSFLFVLRSAPDASPWRALAATLLRGALRHAGIGGKTTSGYGFFEID